MIDFACKRFDLSEVIQCSLALTKSEVNIIKHLMKNEGKFYTAEDLSKILNLDITTIQRSVKRLYEKNIVFRSQDNLGTGGYVYVYSVKDKDLIRKMIFEVIHKWTKTVKTALDEW